MHFEFIADRPVLDFVATVAERGTTDLEGLRTPADLARWVREAGIVEGPISVAEGDLDRARQARDAMFTVIAALIDGSRIPSEARARLNATAAGERVRLELDGRRRIRRHGELDAVLAELAIDALDLCDSPDRAALHWCADARCTRPFIDRSRGQRRRWCGMAGCGDRAKAAAYRQRQRAETRG